VTDPKQAWNDVADRLSALGLKLKLHAEEETSDDDKSGSSGIERLKASINDIFDTLGNAARDVAVREDAKAVANAFAQAIDATVDEARQRLKQKKD
jgi:hypothetical protein